MTTQYKLILTKENYQLLKAASKNENISMAKLINFCIRKCLGDNIKLLKEENRELQRNIKSNLDRIEHLEQEK